MSSDHSEVGLDQQYSEDGFWDKLRRYALAAGRAVVEKALALYYCALDPEHQHGRRLSSTAPLRTSFFP